MTGYTYKRVCGKGHTKYNTDDDRYTCNTQMSHYKIKRVRSQTLPRKVKREDPSLLHTLVMNMGKVKNLSLLKTTVST
jgi:hypothetical protein